MSQQALEAPVFARTIAQPVRPALPCLEEFASIVAEHRLILEEQKRQIAKGALGVWNGLMWDNSLMYATDAIPLSIVELWQEGVRESHVVAESVYHIPEEFCSSGKSILGRLHLIKNETAKRVVVFAAGCDPRSIVYELLKKEGYDIFTIDTVTVFKNDLGRFEKYVEYIAKEFEGFGPWINGKPIDEDRLRAELRFKNKVLSRIQRLFELRLRNPRLLSFIELQQIAMGSSHFFNQRERFLAFLDQLLSEVEEAVDVYPQAPYTPLILSGIASLSVIRSIEESGGVIVGAVRFGSEQYREDVPPLESLARYLLTIQLRGEGHDISGAPASHRRYLTEELIAQTGAKGIISSGLVSCPFFSMAAQLDQDYFKKKGVPFIALETPGNIREGTPEEAQITRVKAFLEMFS